jgi:alpha-galactosidase
VTFVFIRVIRGLSVWHRKGHHERKVAFVGGGSAKFVRELVVDMFHFPELQETHICLMDIDLPRAQRSEKIVRKIIADRKLPATVEATIDQRKALDGADYVVITIMVGGFEAYWSDYEIPAKYGVHQAVRDTIGPGGMFRIVRTSPVLQSIVKNVRELAPRAWVLNYANPMAMNTWTLLACGQKRGVGLCHSIQGCYKSIAKTLGIDPDEINYTAAGINHVDFYIRLEHKGKDIYPLFLAAAAQEIKANPQEKARFELLEYLVHFPAEGAWHQTEYYPSSSTSTARSRTPNTPRRSSSESSSPTWTCGTTIRTSTPRWAPPSACTSTSR